MPQGCRDLPEAADETGDPGGEDEQNRKPGAERKELTTTVGVFQLGSALITEHLGFCGLIAHSPIVQGEC